MGRLRRRATIARKGIIQILETAREYGHEGEEWHTLSRETEALARALRAVERVDEMAMGVTSLDGASLFRHHQVIDMAPKLI